MSPISFVSQPGSIVVYALVISLLVALFVALVFSITAGMKNSEAYKLGYEKLQSNIEAINALGAPITTGAPRGSIETSGPIGKADLSFSAEGSKSKGTVYLDAVKDLGIWRINRIELEVRGREGRIDLNQ
ncbi:hypothetical protein H6F75_05110 [Nodosilinea sp. FACHB-131]|uniref:cytochrome c oxidase assembly factor Coa1 family protein n=1 Tax=Cyanophyceae TaxID=3028117 RepID=UPI001685D321|nr:cytochrome c oxidase assembly factor Coa1 family protein [Nodosilinea sp. FACHB-131]MBD1872852.1 hypothetical protein [Nodosilinea sp. FACHB-131]